jgi:hypothetical protein
MKAVVKTAWIADLRANPDAQGESALDYIDQDGKRKQCCLGRLCLLAVDAGVIPAPELHGNTYRYLDDDYDQDAKVTGEAFNQESSLPRKVAEWAGLPKDEHGDFADDIIIIPDDGDGGELTAIEANDGVLMTYAEIADEAEKNVPATD